MNTTVETRSATSEDDRVDQTQSIEKHPVGFTGGAMRLFMCVARTKGGERDRGLLRLLWIGPRSKTHEDGFGGLVG